MGFKNLLNRKKKNRVSSSTTISNGSMLKLTQQQHHQEMETTNKDNTALVDPEEQSTTIKSASSNDTISTAVATVYDEVYHGMMYASLAITDDNEGTLLKVAKNNPWHEQALGLITGSTKKAHRRLSDILQQDMQLDLDEIIDISGWTSGGHILDTQGYIAHNDQVIVLSYRCTTSASDWLTNLNATTSAWELDKDAVLGDSGILSGFNNILCCEGANLPRLHTGFYNNFLASLPILKSVLDPLLAPGQPPRKLYVVGHSLGAGIATVAYIYYLLEFDWLNLPHSLVSLTAGSPRVVAPAMRELLQEQLEIKQSKVNVYRLVRGLDLVTKVPPTFMGFRHIVDPIQITIDDKVILPTSDYQEEDIDMKKLYELMVAQKSVYDDVDDDDVEETAKDMSTSEEIECVKSADEKELEEELSKRQKYLKFVKKIPQSIRDHCPDFYLHPLQAARHLSLSKLNNDNNTDDKKANVNDATKNNEEKVEEPVLSLIKSPSTTSSKRSRRFMPRLFMQKSRSNFSFASRTSRKSSF